MVMAFFGEKNGDSKESHYFTCRFINVVRGFPALLVPAVLAKYVSGSLAFILVVCSVSGEDIENRTFKEQYKRVQEYIENHSLSLKKENVPGEVPGIVEGLLTLETGKKDDFLAKEKQNRMIPVSGDLKKFTAVILNPVLEEKRVLYPLLFGDVSDIRKLKGVVLYTDPEGKIVYADVHQKITPVLLVKLVDDSFYPDESVMKMDMIDKKPNGREIKFSFVIRAVRDYASIMEFTAPRRELGKKILLKKDNLWMYSPRISRPVRLSTRQKFMGTSFSNNDLMDISLADDYDITVRGTDTVKGAANIKLECIAKDNSVTYPKLLIWFRKDNLVATRIDYYTPSGKILKRMITEEIKMLGGRERASRLVMQNMFEKDARTVIEMKEISIQNVPRNVFTESYLKR